MTYTSDRAAGRVPTRRRRRQRQKVRHFRVHRSTRRVLREQAASNVEECFGRCSDRGFHCDPDINIGSGVDPSREFPPTLSKSTGDAHLTIGNQFSTLDSGWSSATSSQNITPLKSSLTFTSANPCSSSAQSSFTSLILPSVPTTPPSHPTVKLPDTVFKHRPPEAHSRPGSLYTSHNDACSSHHAPFGLPPIPSPFLYHNESRELLQGIDESDPSLAKSFSKEGRRDAPNPDFKSYRMDFTTCDGRDRQGHPDRDAESNHGKGPLFVGAALPDMSKTVPARAITVERPGPDSYRYARSYLRPSNNPAEHSTIASASTPNHLRGNTSQSKGAHLPILATTDTFPRWLRTMTDVFTEPGPKGQLLTPSLKTNHQPDASWDEPGLWGPIALPRMQQQTNVPDFIFPKLTPTAICRKLPKSWCKNTNNGCVRRMTDFWDSIYDSHSRMTDLCAREVRFKSSSDAKASDIDLAMSAFEEIMSKKRADVADITKFIGLWIQPDNLQATNSGWGSQTRIPVQLRHFTLHTIRRSPIRDAAIQSAISPSTLSEPSKSNGFAAGPSSTCSALVPSTLYEYQYLGWPGRRTGEDIVYKDETWLTLGAYIAHLQEELAGGGSAVDMATKEGANPSAGIEEAEERVPGHLDVKLDSDKERQHAEAWLQALAGQSDFMSDVSDNELDDMLEARAKSDGVEDSAKECFPHCAVSQDNMALSFFDQTVESPGSGISWSEIGTEDESEEDWDWSEGDLEA